MDGRDQIRHNKPIAATVNYKAGLQSTPTGKNQFTTLQPLEHISDWL